MGKERQSDQKERHYFVRLEVGKGLILLANLAGGSLLFGQAVSNNQFNFSIALVGFLVMPFLYFLAVAIMKGGGQEK